MYWSMDQCQDTMQEQFLKKFKSSIFQILYLMCICLIYVKLGMGCIFANFYKHSVSALHLLYYLCSQEPYKVSTHFEI